MQLRRTYSPHAIVLLCRVRVAPIRWGLGHPTTIFRPIRRHTWVTGSELLGLSSKIGKPEVDAELFKARKWSWSSERKFHVVALARKLMSSSDGSNIVYSIAKNIRSIIRNIVHVKQNYFSWWFVSVLTVVDKLKNRTRCQKQIRILLSGCSFMVAMFISQAPSVRTLTQVSHLRTLTILPSWSSWKTCLAFCCLLLRRGNKYTHMVRSQYRQFAHGAGWRFRRSVETSLSAQLVLMGASLLLVFDISRVFHARSRMRRNAYLGRNLIYVFSTHPNLIYSEGMNPTLLEIAPWIILRVRSPLTMPM